MTKDNLERNLYMLRNSSSGNCYDWWWHSFTGRNTATGEDKSFFIEYYIVNPNIYTNSPKGFTPILGCNGQHIPSYVMIKAGCWGKEAKQLHRFFSTNEMDMSEDELHLVVGDCFLSEDLIKGCVEVNSSEAEEHPELMCNSGSMSWQLHITKHFPFNVGYGASKLFRKLNLFEMFWHVQGMKTEYEGTVYLDGQEYCVTPSTSYGYADKNWGRDFTSPWVWLSSCNIKSIPSGRKLHSTAFDIGGGRPKAGPFVLDRRLLMCLYYENTRIEFNFSKFWSKTRTKFKCYETEDNVIWRIKTTNRNYAMELDACCRKEDMLLINYEAPDGIKRHNRLWNGGNGTAKIKLYRILNGRKHLIDHLEAKNVGCEYGEYD